MVKIPKNFDIYNLRKNEQRLKQNQENTKKNLKKKSGKTEQHQKNIPMRECSDPNAEVDRTKKKTSTRKTRLHLTSTFAARLVAAVNRTQRTSGSRQTMAENLKMSKYKYFNFLVKSSADRYDSVKVRFHNIENKNILKKIKPQTIFLTTSNNSNISNHTFEGRRLKDDPFRPYQNEKRRWEIRKPNETRTCATLSPLS